jgi:hypothetical protein
LKEAIMSANATGQVLPTNPWKRLVGAGEWAVLLPLWRRLISNQPLRVAAACGTGLLWVILSLLRAGGRPPVGLVVGVPIIVAVFVVSPFILMCTGRISKMRAVLNILAGFLAMIVIGGPAGGALDRLRDSRPRSNGWRGLIQCRFHPELDSASIGPRRPRRLEKSPLCGRLGHHGWQRLQRLAFLEHGG